VKHDLRRSLTIDKLLEQGDQLEGNGVRDADIASY